MRISGQRMRDFYEQKGLLKVALYLPEPRTPQAAKMHAADTNMLFALHQIICSRQRRC